PRAARGHAFRCGTFIAGLWRTILTGASLTAASFRSPFVPVAAPSPSTTPPAASPAHFAIGSRFLFWDCLSLARCGKLVVEVVQILEYVVEIRRCRQQVVALDVEVSGW